jgi:hypothetical protein
VFGVAVLTAIFLFDGQPTSGQAFVDGLRPATLFGALFVAIGAVAAFGIPHLRRMAHPEMQPEAAPIGDGIPVPALGSPNALGLGGRTLDPVTVPVEESMDG